MRTFALILGWALGVSFLVATKVEAGKVCEQCNHEFCGVSAVSPPRTYPQSPLGWLRVTINPLNRREPPVSEGSKIVDLSVPVLTRVCSAPSYQNHEETLGYILRWGATLPQFAIGQITTGCIDFYAQKLELNGICGPARSDVDVYRACPARTYTANYSCGGKNFTALTNDHHWDGYYLTEGTPKVLSSEWATAPVWWPGRMIVIASKKVVYEVCHGGGSPFTVNSYDVGGANKRSWALDPNKCTFADGFSIEVKQQPDSKFDPSVRFRFSRLADK